MYIGGFKHDECLADNVGHPPRGRVGSGDETTSNIVQYGCCTCNIIMLCTYSGLVCKLCHAVAQLFTDTA